MSLRAGHPQQRGPRHAADAHTLPRCRVDAGQEGEAFYHKAALQNVEFNMIAWLRADKARSNSAGTGTQPQRFTLTFR